MEETMDLWHEIVNTKDGKQIPKLLAENVVFYSPVIHKPQKGIQITSFYLSAALNVLANQSFKYVRDIRDKNNVVLEFETVIDGIEVNGVDLVKFNNDGKIVEFKVMVRPLKAINILREKMTQMMESLKS